MKNQKLKAKKEAKANARRKKYKKIINVKRNNVAKKTFKVEEPIMKSVKNEKTGKIEYKQIGKRVVTKSLPNERLRAGEGVLPTSKKYRENRREKTEKKQIIINRIAKTSATGNN